MRTFKEVVFPFFSRQCCQSRSQSHRSFGQRSGTLVESKKRPYLIGCWKTFLFPSIFIFQILNSKITISFGFLSIRSWRWSRNNLFYNLPVPSSFCFCRYSNCHLRDTKYWNLFWLIKCISLVSYFPRFKCLECIRRCIYTHVYCLASEK